MKSTEDWLTQPDGLADRLRTLRTQAGLSGKDLAAALGWPASKVSRLENGRQMPTAPDIRVWARACHAADAVDDLSELLAQALTVHREWKRRLRRGQVAVQSTYNQLVENAAVVRGFEMVVVPGLLQTPDYARHIMEWVAAFHELETNDAAAATMTRLQRQQALYDPTKRFDFLIAEAVLHWRFSSAEVMHAQLDRLQVVIGLPNVRFGVVPFEGPLTVIPANSFEIYDDIVVVETFTGETIHREADAASYVRIMDRLWQDAVEGDGARRLILKAAADLIGETPMESRW